MGFTIRKRSSYRWTVEHVIELRDGKPVSIDFDMEFKALPHAEVKTLVEQISTGKVDDDAFLAAVAVGWRDVKDEQGEAVEFSQEALKSLCEMYPGLPGSISAAWFKSVMGGAARKN